MRLHLADSCPTSNVCYSFSHRLIAGYRGTVKPNLTACWRRTKAWTPELQK